MITPLPLMPCAVPAAYAAVTGSGEWSAGCGTGGSGCTGSSTDGEWSAGGGSGGSGGRQASSAARRPSRSLRSSSSTACCH